MLTCPRVCPATYAQTGEFSRHKFADVVHCVSAYTGDHQIYILLSCAAGGKRQTHRVRAPSALAAQEASIPALTSNPETATWDPEGLLSRTPVSGGHFDRRDRKQKL